MNGKYFWPAEGQQHRRRVKRTHSNHTREERTACRNGKRKKRKKGNKKIIENQFFSHKKCVRG